MATATLSIIIPVLNEEKNLPPLFRALRRESASTPIEVVFVDNGSTDRSLELLHDFQRKQKFPVIVARERKKGFAPPLNRGVQQASSDLLVSLDADALPEPGWARAILRTLKKYDVAVGNTVTKLGRRSTAAEKAAAFLFAGFSQKAAKGKSHALPWGPTCNLGFRRHAYNTAGPFDEALGSAFDLAWCWSAVRAGCVLHYAPRAIVRHARRKSETDFLKQMYRYGTGEAALAHSFSSLHKVDLYSDPQTPAREAYECLRKRMGRRPLAKKTAAAFASGVAAGYAARQKGIILAPHAADKEHLNAREEK